MVGYVKSLVYKWLGIQPAASFIDIQIVEDSTKELSTLKNQIWYRGDASELEQFYHQMGKFSLSGRSRITATKFWAAEPPQDVMIRKFHSGIPRLIVDKLASIVCDDMSEVKMSGGELQRWEPIAEENTFDELLKDASTKILSEGDGAFKISYDPSISLMPLIEFFSGNDVDFEYKRGKLIEIIYFTNYSNNVGKRYRLCEHYGKNYVRYALKDTDGKDQPLDTLDETKDLKDATFTGDFIMGVPVKFYNSAKYAHRGESILEGKGDSFDALDEVLSTWLDGIRAGRVKQYIPDHLVPRNEENGTLLKPSIFNSFMIKNTDLGEDADNKIEVIQGDVKFEGLLSSYVTLLDTCLQGLISPSTLGIDVKKLDNAESQREKEKTTMYTRDTIIGVLMKVLPRVVDIALKVEDTIKGRMPAEKYEATFEWGQYANPSFEAMVETVGKAKQYGIMSIERCVEELYGDTMTPEDKAKEIALLKAETASVVEEPAVNNDEGDDEDEFGGGKKVTEDGEEDAAK